VKSAVWTVWWLQRLEVDTDCERDRARVHLEDLAAAEPVGWLHGDATVESAWT
jgi:hypothetical protein